ncbi:hypothetical protein ABB37_07131 [Leptomonas pyrrhocoris]|uniref:Uncharacterized protein n=1 Tax=Leptomonas pyrrhocoris TaxID=157538 RepID=A0A0N0VE89_LEPPY|nr:hypothetical protein ABB37_07131 [Leptomonas pyrrhocoris]KPA77224.1 hypothetical protein ABB37_07131 [Leptomonas pyrrhocoris]|eukprot:XP_015655663.1 hypothetical protein ABB37_07131 [Leptomonas pyrrhocoris]
MKQRAGQQFTYEARRNVQSEYEAMLDDASYNYPYVFTEDMSRMLQDLFNHSTLQTLGGGVTSIFEECTYNAGGDPNVAIYSGAGCVKSLLHAGIAADCVAPNPLCCVLYWRYPPSLADRLPVLELDPQLIFWDGARPVNGFYTNFSAKYLQNNSNCTAWPAWPTGGSSPVDGAALAVDATGEWRFTRRRQPALSFVEHRITTPTAEQSTNFDRLSAAGTTAWEKVHQFGDIPAAGPIVACVCLLVLCLVLLLVFYCCTEPQARRAQSELREKIDALASTTADQEAEICRRRTRSERKTPQSERQTPSSCGSFSKPAKQSLSPVPVGRSSSTPSRWPSQAQLMDQRNGSGVRGVLPSPSASPRQALARTPSRPPPSRVNSASPGVLSRQGSHFESPQRNVAGPSRRASITSDHRRKSKNQDRPQQLPQADSSLSRNGSSTAGVPARAASRHSSVASPSQRPVQTFQNPLIGRQSFKN